MKTIISTAIILIFSANAYADCGRTQLEFWPKGKTIKQNSIIMIEGGIGEVLLKELNNKYQIYLKSSNHKVKLITQEILIGEYYTSQIILRPEETLVEGLDYQLFIDSIANNELPLKKWNPETKEYEPVQWTVELGTDTIVPIFKSIPEESNKILDYYSSSCGDEIFVLFKVNIEEQSEFLVKTIVRDKKEDKSTTFYLIINGDEIHVGHKVCSGAFYLQNGREYEVEFSLIDASGNVDEEIISKIDFSVPKIENE